MYKPEDAGSGQWGVCAKCGLGPTKDGDEVYDGCLGKLPGPIMNVCCGHGNNSQAYIQYWEEEEGGERLIIRGDEAIDEQRRLISNREEM